MMLSEKILTFFKSLKIKGALPAGVEILNPYRDREIVKLCEQFYQKYYDDNVPRHLIVGINPGRLGGGLTGILFTDPNKLEKFCGIPNSLKKKSELSADFIYQVISAFGGPEKFYSKFYFSSVSPLGFTMDQKNLNYYDLTDLETTLRPFIVDCMKKQIAFGLKTDTCFVLGEGKNYAHIKKLNDEFRFFIELVPLPHPRFIMQYRRKRVKDYVEMYAQLLCGGR
jgi:Domain of unknown function (DUF4918)